MKLATYKWNVRIVGERKPIYYYGFTTKKDAVRVVEQWNSNPSHDTKLEVVKYDDDSRTWIKC